MQRLEPGAVCLRRCSLQRVPTCIYATARVLPHLLPAAHTHTYTHQAHLVRKVLLPHRQMRAVHFTAAPSELHTLFKQWPHCFKTGNLTLNYTNEIIMSLSSTQRVTNSRWICDWTRADPSLGGKSHLFSFVAIQWHSSVAKTFCCFLKLHFYFRAVQFDAHWQRFLCVWVAQINENLWTNKRINMSMRRTNNIFSCSGR